MQQLRALSVRQPWAHAIVHHGKDIENRSRRLGHRGWTLIHASGSATDDEVAAALGFMSQLGVQPDRGAIRWGGIVGVAKIIDAVDASASSWWMGPYGLVIDRAHPLPFVECKGTVAPMFWRPDQVVLDRLRPALDALQLTP
jgi:hypothetical protein